MRTTVEPLEGNKVKLSVEVDEQEFERALDDAFRKIAREVRIPGFRPGKVPRRILEARIGTDVAREQALRDSLPGYYAQAVRENDVDVIAPPEIDITGGADDGPVAFDAVVEIRPRITVPGYGALRVEVPAVAVTDEEVDAQVERLRGQFGELNAVERPARSGDHVSIDIAGSFEGEPVEGLTADDYLYEVGSEAVVPELDARLHGAKVGDILEFDAEHPDPDEDGELHFRILVKDVKEKVLPELDDEWANEASEFETLDALRADIAERIGNMKRVQAQLALRNGVVDSLVALVDEEPPDALVMSEVERRANDLVHRLSHQGATLEQYLEATGRTQEQLLGELREAAVPAVKADLALRAVAEIEDLHATDQEVDAEIASLAERLGQKPAAVRKEFERAGQVQAVRSDIRKGKALEWLVEHAEIVDPDGRPVDRSELQPPADQPEDAVNVEAAEPAQPDEETVE